MTRPSSQTSFRHSLLCKLFIVLLTTLFLGQPTKRSAHRAALPNLQGTAAIEHLKQQGLYASLSEAVTAARYGVYEAPANVSAPYRFYANNPAQGLEARFSPDGLSLKTTAVMTEDHPLNLKLHSVGYGAQQFPVTPGTLTANRNRVEIAREIQFRAIKLQTEITEWYENKANGIEQGFTLAQPPGDRRANEPLRLTLQVEADWQMQPLDDNQAIAFHNTFTGKTLRYDKLLVTDSTGRELTSQMQLQDHELQLAVEDAAAVYPLTIDPTITQVKKLTAPDGVAWNIFGGAVAVDGDTIVVGAYGDEAASIGIRGSAYVFSRNQGGGNNWGQVAKLTASDGSVNNKFGISVAVDGDTIVIGAIYDDIGTNGNQGSAYVFNRNQSGPNNWGQVTKLVSSDGASNDFFGVRVAVDGDTIVVGAYGNDAPISAQGAAYIFSRNQGGANNWGEVKKLTASVGVAGAQFGIAVGVDGDTIVVGAFGDTVGANAQGSAYVFSRNQGGANNWGEVKKLTASDGTNGDYFGYALSIDGDTIVVGAIYGDIGASSDQGSAYVFSRNQGGANNWGQVIQLTASDGAAGDNFGIMVEVDGDTIVIGAVADAVGGNIYQGSAYVFSRNQGGANNWGEFKKLTASDGAAVDQFGVAVAVDGDTIVVGARLGDVGANINQGSAYIFSGLDCNFTQQAHPIASDGAAGDAFGYAVALDGDTVVVGALQDDVGANTDQGSAYVFSRNQGGAGVWGQVKKLTASDGMAFDNFGYAVAVNGDTIVVGAASDDVGAGANEGSAYVFSRNQGGANNWGEVKRLTATVGVASAAFGFSVAVNGDTIVVGAIQDNVGVGSTQGSAYVFSRNQGGANNWGEVKKLAASDGATIDQFGRSVAVDGDTIVVGATQDKVGANDFQGSAYVFSRNQGGANNWGEVKKLTASDGAALDYFGFWVAMDGDTIVVGAVWDNVGLKGDQGSAYVFSRNQGGANNWGEVKKLIASDGMANDQFGVAVTLDGDTIVVGASQFGVGANQLRGLAYVFSRNQGGANNWGEVKKLTASDGAAGDRFGNAVAVDGDTIVVGAVFDDVSANDFQGSAYVFSGVAVCCPIITVTAPAINTGTAGALFGQTFTQSGGTGAITWSETGALPTGITLNSSTGTLSGTTTQTGTFLVTVKATDANGCFGTVNYTLTIISAPPLSTVRIDDPLVCTGSGNTVLVTATLTNPNATAQSANFTATLNAALVAVPGSCTASVNDCTVTNSSTVTWNGMLNAGQTVTIRYLAQVADGLPPGAQLCATSVATVGNSLPATVTVCGTVNCPTQGPGQPFPASSEASDQSAGSVLIYNVYTSGATSGNTQNTRVNITNTHPKLPAFVHLFFVAEGCSIADSYVCLTANQTTSFLASDLDPGTSGYLVAVAVDGVRGCPTNFNYLIGDEYVKFSTGHAANLGAQSFSAIPGGLPACDGNSVTAQLNFDGVSYNRLPAVLALSNVGSRADGNDTLLILNRIGGNLGTGATTLGSLFGIMYDDAENALSFSVSGNCQLRSSVSNNFPRTTPRFETFIPAGRTGWLKVFSQTGTVGIMGAAINFNSNAASSAGAFNQGHNLHSLTLNSTNSYTIPVFPPSC